MEDSTAVTVSKKPKEGDSRLTCIHRLISLTRKHFYKKIKNWKEELTALRHGMNEICKKFSHLKPAGLQVANKVANSVFLKRVHTAVTKEPSH